MSSYEWVTRKIGFVTIGQSPRSDILEEVKPLLGPLEVIERGALDGLSGAEIEALAPAQGEPVYVSRLRDGSQVLLSREGILPLLQKAVDSVADRVEMVVMLCTGSFPTLQCPVPVLYPDRLLRDLVRAKVPPESTLGVLVPLPEQAATAQESWEAVIPGVRVASFSPYLEPAEELEKRAALEECAVIVMDCLGYTREHEEMVRRLLKRPVILARTVVARAVRQLVSWGGRGSELLSPLQ